MPRARKRRGSADVDLASEPIGDLDFDAGLPDRASRAGARRARVNKRVGRPGYDHESELGEGHALGEPGQRYADTSLNFDDGLRETREIVVKNDDDDEIEDDDNRQDIDKAKGKGKDKPQSKAAPHVHTLKIGDDTLTTTEVSSDEGVSHTHRVTFKGDTLETSSDPGGAGHEHTLTVDGKKVTTSDPIAPTKKSDIETEDDETEDEGPTVAQVIDLVKADKSEVQTLIFSKTRFKAAGDAKVWAKENGFKSNKVDETDESFRLRQKEPGSFQDDSFRTITLTDGVKAVIGRPKKAGATKPAKKADETDEFPEVLTWTAVRKRLMPSEGSGLPASLEADVPPAYRYWKCDNEDDAIVVRDALVESRMFTPDKVMKVDGELRRAVVETVQKLYLAPEYDDGPVEIPEPVKPIVKAQALLKNPDAERAIFDETLTGVIGIDILLDKVEKLDGEWIIAAKDSAEIRKAIAGPCFRLWSDENVVFVTNAEIVDRTSVEWVQLSRAEELVKFAFSKGREIKIAKATEERIVFGIVLEPDGVDAQEDTISKNEIRQAAHKFMEDFGNLGLQHNEIVNGRLKLLETFIAPVDFKVAGQLVKEGSWLMKERVVDDELWAAIKAGEITGFSIGGSAIRRPA